jgi:hypothetical protein
MEPSFKQKMNLLAEKLHDFLTEQQKKHSDMNARITSGDTLRALQLWRLLGKKGVKEADDMADILERLTVSLGGRGREEIVDALRSVPKTSPAGRLGGVPPEEEEAE